MNLCSSPHLGFLPPPSPESRPVPFARLFDALKSNKALLRVSSVLPHPLPLTWMSSSRSSTPTQKPPSAHANIPIVHDTTPGPSQPHDPITTAPNNPLPRTAPSALTLPSTTSVPRAPSPSALPSRGATRKAESDLEEESPMAKRMRRASLEPSERHHEDPRSSPSSDSQSGMADTEIDQRKEVGQGASTSAPAPQKKKRTRTLTTPHQSAVLHALLAQSRFPTTAMREEVGRAIGLSARKVQIWFQNQRQKARRPRPQGEPAVRTPQYGAFPSGPHSSMIMYPGSGQIPSVSPYTVAGPSTSRNPEFHPGDYPRSFPPPQDPPMTASSEGNAPRLLGPGMPGYPHSRHRSTLSYGRTPPMSAPPTGAYSSGSSIHRYGSPSRSSMSPVMPSSATLRPVTAQESSWRERDPSRILPLPIPSRPSTAAHPHYVHDPRLSSLRTDSPFPIMPPILPRRTPSPERFAHRPPEAGLGHSPITLPPPFTLQPAPQWDPSTYSSAPRPDSGNWSRPASRPTNPQPVAAAETFRTPDYRGPHFERHTQILERAPPTFPSRVGYGLPSEEIRSPSPPLPRVGRYDPVREMFIPFSPPPPTSTTPYNTRKSEDENHSSNEQ